MHAVHGRHVYRAPRRPGKKSGPGGPSFYPEMPGGAGVFGGGYVVGGALGAGTAGPGAIGPGGAPRDGMYGCDAAALGGAPPDRFGAG